MQPRPYQRDAIDAQQGSLFDAPKSGRLQLAGMIRRDAIAKGKKKYFTGIPCKHGHVAERWSNNTECVVCRKAWAKSSYKQHKRGVYLQKTYGISEEQYNAMLAAQGGRCKICASEETANRWGRFHVDHHHGSGVVRGVLCGRCNQGIGLLGDNSERIRLAAAYVDGNGTC